ncbi:MAG TPA: alkaline phosphatase family protein [Planctomycetota bacterium]
MMRRLFALVFLALAACELTPETGVTPELTPPALTARPAAAKAKRVVVISIDGLRPDAIEAAPAPALLGMIRRGAYCEKAETIRPSITLPSHTAMLSGLDYRRHGVSWNNYRPGHFGHPSVFSVTAQAGMSTAMFFSKDKFHYLAHPQAVTWIWGNVIPGKVPKLEDYNDIEWVERRQRFYDENDKRIAAGQKALPDPEAPPPGTPAPAKAPEHRTSAENIGRAFEKEWPQGGWAMTFVHVREADGAGHGKGWMGLDYLDAVRKADRAVGRILDAIRDSGQAETTAVIVTADHGGSGKGHYRIFEPNKVENVTIPWICVGPGVPAGLKIDRIVRTYDTAPTALAFIGLGYPEGIDGRPVLEVLSK